MAYVDPDVQRLLDQFDPAARDFASLTPAELRANAELTVLDMREPIEIDSVSDLVIPTSAGEIRGRLYRPTRERNEPLFVYFHGGGWELGSLDLPDRPLRRLAKDSGFAILSVDYRLTPEHPFPAGFDDCYDATVWAAEHTAQLGLSSDWLVVGGDSAGGNLAAGVAQAARDRGIPRVDHQLLVYPVVTPDFTSASYDSFAEGHFLTRTAMQHYWNIYTGESAPQYADLLATDTLAGLAPATVFTCALDPLSSEGELYARALDAAGVPTTFTNVGGLIHGIWYRDGVSTAAYRFGLMLADALRNSLPVTH